MKISGWSQEPQDIISRLMDKVNIVDSGCWMFTGHIGRNGYGLTSLFGKTCLAHRASYRLYIGEIPRGLHLHHLCATRCCVNPQHLQAVTPRMHMLLLSPNAPAFKNHVRTQCLHGHPFTSDNTLLLYRKGAKYVMRVCRTCKRLASRVRREKANPRRKLRLYRRRADTI